jgi:hypothetical protein
MNRGVQDIRSDGMEGVKYYAISQRLYHLVAWDITKLEICLLAAI